MNFTGQALWSKPACGSAIRRTRDTGPGTVWGYREGEKEKEVSLVWDLLSLKCLWITQVRPAKIPVYVQKPSYFIKTLSG